MDNDLAKNRFSDYFLTMANLEAHQLSNLAAKLADRHLKNAIVRSDFKDDIQKFISHQLQTIRSAKSDTQCRQCVSNLQQERAYLDTQEGSPTEHWQRSDSCNSAACGTEWLLGLCYQ